MGQSLRGRDQCVQLVREDLLCHFRCGLRGRASVVGWGGGAYAFPVPISAMRMEGVEARGTDGCKRYPRRMFHMRC